MNDLTDVWNMGRSVWKLWLGTYYRTYAIPRFDWHRCMIVMLDIVAQSQTLIPKVHMDLRIVL